MPKESAHYSRDKQSECFANIERALKLSESREIVALGMGIADSDPTDGAPRPDRYNKGRFTAQDFPDPKGTI